MNDERGWKGAITTSSVIVVCGTGGVGKTTVAAALAARAAVELGRRVAVLTVDPARRLATALGLDLSSATEREVRVELPAAAAGGELWATMLDPERAWDDLVGRAASSIRDRDALIANPLYRQLTRRFAHAQAYVALERMCELLEDDRFDLVVVDTPPSRHALELLEAPQRMDEFFRGRLVRWLTMPARSRLVSTVTRPFWTIADRVLGGGFLSDIAELFALMQAMESGLVGRAARVDRVLGSPSTMFCGVTTLEAAPLAETRLLIEALAGRGTPMARLAANRVVPSRFGEPALRGEATRWIALPGLVDGLAEDLASTPEVVERVFRAIDLRVTRVGDLARRQVADLAELEVIVPTVAVPLTDGPLGDVDGLLGLAGYLWT